MTQRRPTGRQLPGTPNINFEELTCALCDKFLSVPPITLRPDHESICGRCYDDEVKSFTYRNTTYEKLASKLKFPCTLQKHGCKELIAFEDVKQHEENCPCREFECPSFTCKWLGRGVNILDHFKENHQESVIINENSWNFVPDCSKDKERKAVLLDFYGVLFVIIMKLKENILYHSLQIVPNPDIPEIFKTLFEYHVKIFKKDSKTMKLITEEIKWYKLNDSENETCLTNMLRENETHDCLTFSFEIHENILNCMVCKKELKFLLKEYSAFLKNHSPPKIDIHLGKRNVFCGQHGRLEKSLYSVFKNN